MTADRGPGDGPWDAVVVGAGPNGLAAAVTMARAGRSVLLVEAAETVGGGTRTEALTIDGFRHDVCSAVHPLGVASPFLRSLPLERHGLRWLHAEVPLAHPLGGDRAGALFHDLEETAARFGRRDGAVYRRVVEPLVARWPAILDGLLGPLLPPRRPLAMARFGARGALPATWLARAFAGDEARATLAGLSAHSCVDLGGPFTAGIGLLLGVSAHVDGWPVAEGGSQAIADALAAHLVELGGEVRTGWRVRTLDELPPARTTLLDVTPAQFVALAGDRLTARARGRLTRFRYGTGVCKLDWALDGPVPWQAEVARRAGTVHVGGDAATVARAEADTVAGRVTPEPFVLVAQPSLVDPTRAPAGQQAVWAYCHTPRGTALDRADAIEAQIERYAPGFRDRILARSVRTSADLERDNPNYVGGDIGAGALDGWQLLFRPRPSLHPYRTPVPGVWLCSASTPPGGGVHGMAGFRAASDALRLDP